MKHVVPLLLALLLIQCSGRQGGTSTYEAEVQEIENPYSEGTGHYAGYEWAERTGGSCNGNSTSFNEGCEEFYLQTRNQ